MTGIKIGKKITLFLTNFVISGHPDGVVEAVFATWRIRRPLF